MFRTTPVRIGVVTLSRSTFLRIPPALSARTSQWLSLRYQPSAFLNSFHNFAPRSSQEQPAPNRRNDNFANQVPFPIDHKPFIYRPPKLPPLEDGNDLVMSLDAKSALSQYTKPNSVAILGGGITGMTAAFWLKFLQPDLHVTIFEKSDRLGGWIETKMMEYEGRKIPMETGPRTLRQGPNNYNLIDMVRRLKLEKELLVVPKESPAAQSRYMWLMSKLFRLPSSGDGIWNMLKTAMSTPLLRHAALKILKQPKVPPRDPSIQDETIAEFVTRRTSKRIADELVSAVVHGIYAGDINKLSAKSTFGKFWAHEPLFGYVNVSKKSGPSAPLYSSTELLHRLELLNGIRHANFRLIHAVTPYNILLFRNGIETLVRALEADLREKNVRIVKNRKIESLIPNAITDSITCKSADGRQEVFSHVISTIPGPQLDNLLPKSIPELKNIEAVTCQVINLYFKTPNLTPPGFGYLIPQSTPPEENPHNVLGVIFDSDTRDDCIPLFEYSTEFDEMIPGTLVTVMMGGHYWQGRTSYPSSEEAVMHARDTLARHLGITEEPVLTNVSLQKDCIPQYTVGHEERMGNVFYKLAEMFTCRLSVAGSSYTSVAVPDLMLAGRDVAIGVLGYRAREFKEGFVGLESMLPKHKKYFSQNDFLAAVDKANQDQSVLQNRADIEHKILIPKRYRPIRGRRHK